MLIIDKMRPQDWRYTMKLMQGLHLDDAQVKEAQERHPHSYVILDDQDHILGYMGLIQIDADRAEGWTVFKPELGPHMIQIHKTVKKFLAETQTYRRVEITVVEGFKLGHRWADMLGFKKQKSLERQGQRLVWYTYFKQ